jgi:hypothetical protein
MSKKPLSVKDLAVCERVPGFRTYRAARRRAAKAAYRCRPVARPSHHSYLVAVSDEGLSEPRMILVRSASRVKPHGGTASVTDDVTDPGSMRSDRNLEAFRAEGVGAVVLPSAAPVRGQGHRGAGGRAARQGLGAASAYGWGGAGFQRCEMRSSFPSSRSNRARPSCPGMAPTWPTSCVCRRSARWAKTTRCAAATASRRTRPTGTDTTYVMQGPGSRTSRRALAAFRGPHGSKCHGIRERVAKVSWVRQYRPQPG